MENTQGTKPGRMRTGREAQARRRTAQDSFDEATRLSPKLTPIDGTPGDAASGEAFDTAGKSPENRSAAPGQNQPRDRQFPGNQQRVRRGVKRGRMSRFPSGAALGLLGIGLLIGCVVTMGIMKAREEKAIRSAVEARSDTARMDAMKESLSEGNSVLTTLRKTFTEDLVMYKDSKYVFFPIEEELKKHSFVSENVEKLSGGEWQYKDGDKVVSHKGIDVSSHQGEIDWKKVAGDGVEYAIIRAMYRGYGSGKLVEDTSFQTNIKGAAENGIKTGVYVFTQAITREEVEEEVEMLKGLLSPYQIEGPVVVDVEQTAEGTGRMDGLDPELRTDLVKYFCELVKEAGYRPMIYFNIETALLMVDLKELEPFEKWFATYNSDFYFPYDYTVWQYTDKGSINGIDGDVDLDLIF